jgi:hypothetical protein
VEAVLMTLLINPKLQLCEGGGKQWWWHTPSQRHAVLPV